MLSLFVQGSGQEKENRSSRSDQLVTRMRNFFQVGNKTL